MNKIGRTAVMGIGLAALQLTGCHATTPHSQTSGRVSVETEHASVSVAFGERERQTIRDFYNRERGLPPGLAKKRDLPPGLQKQVERNEQLPPGLRTQALPDDLEDRLGPPPEGYIRARVGTDVVLVDADTRVVVDIVTGVAD